jgi:hypothetical protein
LEAIMLLKVQSAIALLTCGCLVSVAASPSSIGFVVTRGQAAVDGAVVRGNSTLFQGSLVEAGDATSDLMLPGGSNLLLQPGSAARVYREHAVLENGTATQRGSQGYLIADGLKVSTLSPSGAVVVGVKDRSHIDVLAQGGNAEIRNPAGTLIARLEAGKAFRFALQASPQNAPQQGTSPSVPQAPPSAVPAAPAAAPGTQLTLHGIVRKDHAGRYGHYLLTDLATNVTYELQGSGLDDLVGGSVEVTGSVIDTPAAQGASRVLSVSDIHQMPLSEMNGSNTTPSAPAAGVPNSVEPPPVSTEGAEVGATPEAKAPPEVSNVPPPPPPLPVHSDTAKIIIIVAIAAGVGVGAALGLAGGKSSTVSPE